jgi:hypothetical protein
MELTDKQIHDGFKTLADNNADALIKACKSLNDTHAAFFKRNKKEMRNALKLLQDKEYVKEKLEW